MVWEIPGVWTDPEETVGQRIRYILGDMVGMAARRTQVGTFRVILARLEQLVFFSSEVWYSHRTSWKRPKNWSRLVPESGEDSANSLLFDKFVVFLQQSIIIGKIRNFEPIFMLCMIFFSLLLVLWLQFDFLDIFLGFETSRYILEWSPNANCFQKMKNSMNNRQCTEIGFFG